MRPNLSDAKLYTIVRELDLLLDVKKTQIEGMYSDKELYMEAVSTIYEDSDIFWSIDDSGKTFIDVLTVFAISLGFTVEFLEEYDVRHRKFFGYIDLDDQKIFISRYNNSVFMAATLVHEILHYYAVKYGYLCRDLPYYEKTIELTVILTTQLIMEEHKHTACRNDFVFHWLEAMLRFGFPSTALSVFDVLAPSISLFHIFVSDFYRFVTDGFEGGSDV